MRKKIKKIFDIHWNCLLFICGLSILIRGDIGRWAYGLTWVTVLVMIWHYCPMLNIDKLLEGKEDE